MNGSSHPETRKTASNPEAERALLGGMLLDNRQIATIRGLLPPPQELPRRGYLLRGEYVVEPVFSDPRNQTIYETVCSLADQGKGVDLTTLGDALDREGNYEAVGGGGYLASLEEDLLSTAYLPDYARIVVQKWQWRGIENATRFAVLKNGEGEPSDQSFSDLSSRIGNILGFKGGCDDTLNVLDFGSAANQELADNDCLMADRILAKGESLSIIGPPGIGKSLLAEYLAVCLVLGRKWCGLEIHGAPLRVLYIQTENSPRRIKRNSAKIMSGLNEEERKLVVENIFVLAPIHPHDFDLNVGNPAARRRLERAVAQFKPDVLIVDPLADFFFGDSENDTNQMFATIKILQEISRVHSPETALVVIHHSRTGRGAAAGGVGFDKSSYARGAKSFFARVRSQVNVVPGSEDDPSLLVIVCGKNNNGSFFASTAVRLDSQTLEFEMVEEFDFEEWESELAGRNTKTGPKRVQPQLVQMILQSESKPVKYGDLVKKVMMAANVGRDKSQAGVSEAKTQGLVFSTSVGRDTFYVAADRPAKDESNGNDD